MWAVGRDAVERLRRQLAVTITGELLAVTATFFIGLFVISVTGAQALSSPGSGWWLVRELPAADLRATDAIPPWEDALRLHLQDEGFATDPLPRLLHTGGELLIYRAVPTGGASYILATGPLAVLVLVCGGSFLAVAVVSLIRCHRGIDAVDALEACGMRAEEYFGNAVHELKAPLMAISGWNEAARSGLVGPDDAHSSIDRETGRMSTLVDQIMRLARADAGRLEARPCRADIRELLYDAERSLAPMAADKGVKLILFTPRPVVCSFDLDLTYTVVLNAMTNALRHSGGTVWLGCSAASGKALLWTVNDGAPISEEDLSAVFERFGKGEHGSTGIGMALARECAKAQGFPLSVQAVHRGTLALLEIPL